VKHPHPKPAERHHNTGERELVSQPAIHSLEGINAHPSIILLFSSELIYVALLCEKKTKKKFYGLLKY
jgi:hypothetical protein